MRGPFSDCLEISQAWLRQKIDKATLGSDWAFSVGEAVEGREELSYKKGCSIIYAIHKTLTIVREKEKHKAQGR